MFELLKMGFEIVLVPETFLLIFLGIIAGTIFGSLPGVSASMAIALCVPFTYVMSPVVAIAFLVAVYCSSVTGGGITAILFKIPGTPSSAPTTFDGYPMALQGMGGEALGISIISSAIGGTVAAIAMALLSPQLSALGLKFGPSELFAVAFLGLSVLTCLEPDNVLKTLISGLLGLFIATIGTDPVIGCARLTFGSTILLGGFDLIPIMIGMFALTEVLQQTVKPRKIGDMVDGGKNIKTKLVSWKLMNRIKGTIIRSSVLGTVIGILPGAGSTIAAFMSYAAEVKLSKHPETYGKGEPCGIAASETANNAATGGSMVPLLSLGIPGGNAAAIMMSALMLQGVQLGPMLARTQPEFLAGVFASMIVSNILMIAVAVIIAWAFAKIINIPYSTLGTIIVVFSIIGSFAVQNNINDVMIMLLFGVIGYIFKACKFNPAALILGLVLGDICESNLRRAVQLTDGNAAAALGKPITATLLTICMILLLYPVAKPWIKRVHGKH